MTIYYVHGNALDPIDSGRDDTKIIAHVCNDRGLFGGGIALQIAQKWPYVKDLYLQDGHKIGESKFYLVEDNPLLYVMNMIAMQDVFHIDRNPRPLDLFNLRRCLFSLKNVSRTLAATVHMPKIGSGYARGDWDDVKSLIENVNWFYDVYIYDLQGRVL